MRYAILADVHANLEALHAVLSDASARTDALVCLGDMVGYGADPGPCLELVGARAVAVTAGDHERGVTDLTELRWLDADARMAAEWTRARLGADHIAWLRALPLVQEVGDATLAHASPRRPEEWEALVGGEDGIGAFGAFLTRLCFVGHTHAPAAWSVGSSGPDFHAGARRIELAVGRRYIVSVGSVGQPRDGDPRAAYAIWDADEGAVEIRRVPYDAATARDKIAGAGLPQRLGDRLMVGV